MQRYTNIMVVDPDSESRKDLVSILRVMNFTSIGEAATPIAAWEILLKAATDHKNIKFIFLSDAEFELAAEFVKRIMKDSILSEAKIILVRSEEQASNAGKLFKLGVIAHINKPFQIEEISKVVGRHLKRIA